MTHGKKIGLAGLLLLMFVTVIYLNHFDNGFQFDDSHTVVGNMFIRDPGNIPRYFTDAETFSSLPHNQSYRPLVTTGLAIDYWVSKNFLGESHIQRLQEKAADPNADAHDKAVCQQKLMAMNRSGEYDPGLSPIAFHIDTFLWFLAQGIMMFFLFRVILNLVAPHQWNDWFSLFITGWYMVHTVNAETLNYVISRSDLYSTALVVAGLLIYALNGVGKRGFLYLIPVFIGILAKPTAVMFFPILAAYILFFEAELSLLNAYKIFTHPKRLTYLAHIGVAALVCAIGYKLVDKMTPPTWVPGGNSAEMYLATQPYVIAHYFRSFFLPTELTADTDWEVVRSLSDPRFAIGMLFIIIMVAIIFVTSRKKEWRPVSFGLIFFFVALIPSSSIIPLAEVMNDHRMYFPFVGLVLSVGWTVCLLVKKWLASVKTVTQEHAAVLGIVTVLLFVAYGYGTYQRNEVWNTGENLWKDVTEKSPNNGRGWMNYGLTLMAQGRLEESYQVYLKAAEMNPNYSYLEINTGIVLNALGRPTEAEPHYLRAKQLDPNLPEAYYYYADFLFKQQRLNEAKDNLMTAIRISPAHHEARYLLMATLQRLNEKGELKKLAEETLNYLPNDPKTLSYLNNLNAPNITLETAVNTAMENPTAENYLELSLQFYRDGQYEKCIEMAGKALELKPGFPEAYNNICAAYNELKQWNKAIEACSKAIDLKPGFELAKNNLHWAESQKALQQH